MSELTLKPAVLGLGASALLRLCGNLTAPKILEHRVGPVLAQAQKQDLSDEALMEAYRDNDVQAFDILFTRYKDILYRYLVRQCSNPSFAEEMFQEVWAGLIKHRQRYEVQAKFKTYLFHIAHNKLVDFYRSQSRVDAVSYEEHSEESFDELLEQRLQPDHQADTLSKIEKLMQILQKLPAAQRDVFLLHEEAGMSLAEIAETMDVSRDTAKSRLRYALQRLRRSMDKYNE